MMKRQPKDGTPLRRLFATDQFDGFGPSQFRPQDEAMVCRQVRGKRAARLREGVQEHAPRAPGVYGMIDGKGRIVYIGKAKNLRSRLLSYFRVNSRDPKAGRILEHTRRLAWEQMGDELAALLRELELIQSLRPRFNVLGLPGLQRHHYICIGRAPAPYVYITNRPTGKEQGIYGPLVARPRSEDAVRRLNDWFKLRDCAQTVPMAFADQPDLFGRELSPRCLRFELRTCCGPCAGECSRKQYSTGVRGVKSFLDGRDRTPLRTIQGLMETAAQELQFEKATAMRDRLQSLEWLDARLSLIRQARGKNSFLYPLVGSDERERWYLIVRGQVRAVCFPPRTHQEVVRTTEVLTSIFAESPGAVVLSGGTIDSVLLVAAWFRKHPAERLRLLSDSQALERCSPQAIPSVS